MRHVLLIALCLLASPAFSSMIIPRPLAQVAAEAPQVFTGRVEKTERREVSNGVELKLTVTPLQVLRGTALPGPVELVYHHRDPVIRDQDGKVIASISLQIDGSGRELSVREGETWLFFVRPVDGGTIFLLRVEPEERAKEPLPPFRP